MVSLEAELEVSTLGDWLHVSSPLDNWALYETLTDGLLAAKRDYRAALAAHDHARAAVMLAEVADLNVLCAHAADQLAWQRTRFLSGGRLWPLSTCVV